jgi:VanZ family protein
MQRQSYWLIRLIAGSLALYWLALFAGTHWPKPLEHSIGFHDKLLHFSGFFGLAFLLILWRLLSGAGGVWRQSLLVIAIVVAYGAADEITQIPVGRDGEFMDWVADFAGAVCGTSVAVLGLATWRRLRPAKTT